MNWDTEGKQIKSGTESIEKEQVMMEYHKTLIWGTSNSIINGIKGLFIKKWRKII